MSVAHAPMRDSMFPFTHDTSLAEARRDCTSVMAISEDLFKAKELSETNRMDLGWKWYGLARTPGDFGCSRLSMNCFHNLRILGLTLAPAHVHPPAGDTRRRHGMPGDSVWSEDIDILGVGPSHPA